MASFYLWRSAAINGLNPLGQFTTFVSLQTQFALDNKAIIRQLKQTAQLMELHGENAFKIRSYTSAVFNLEKLDQPLAEMDRDTLVALDGVGKSLADGILQLVDIGMLPALQVLLDKTPPGVVDMLEIKGIGPKKIRTIWQELQVETIEGLLEATEQDKIAGLKGFGQKTQETIKQALLYRQANANKLHYAKAEAIADVLLKGIEEKLPEAQAMLTGALRRKLEIIDTLEVLVGANDRAAATATLLSWEAIHWNEKASGPFTLRGTWVISGTPVAIYFSDLANYMKQLLLTSASPTHLSTIVTDDKSLRQILANVQPATEKEAYALAGMAYIEPELREGQFELELAKEDKLPKLVTMDDLKGILHNHSTYSDGKHSLRDMAIECRDLGYQYLGISDHSKSAFYANGLEENRIVKQHEEIDALNEELAPFRIFKGIESDILNDGALDYADDVLSSFDFIVASIHSGLRMDIKKATDRLLTAIANPHTTMLGHPTGRLLLRREGYPIDHKTVIDACAKYGVVIEINAHPWRLDLDWRWVHYAIEQGVQLSINPDAHEKDGYKDMYFGHLVGRKGGLTAEMTFNAKSVEEVAEHFANRKAAIANPA